MLISFPKSSSRSLQLYGVKDLALQCKHLFDGNPEKKTEVNNDKKKKNFHDSRSDKPSIRFFAILLAYVLIKLTINKRGN